MTVVAVTLSSISNQVRSGLNNVMRVIDAVPAAKATPITTSAVSQQASVTSPEKSTGLFWEVTAIGGNVWVQFGSNPVAAVGSDYLIANGTTRNFAAAAGQKIAVIDGA